MPFSVTPQQKTFVLGLSISILILFAFFGGALADRIFVVKPLDVLTGTARLPVSKGVVKTANQDSLLDDSLGRSSSWIADIVAVSADSVVTVASVKQQRVTVPGDAGIFGLLDGGETKIATEQLRQVQQAVGTGFAVEGDFVITNHLSLIIQNWPTRISWINCCISLNYSIKCLNATPFNCSNSST